MERVAGGGGGAPGPLHPSHETQLEALAFRCPPELAVGFLRFSAKIFCGTLLFIAAGSARTFEAPEHSFETPLKISTPELGLDLQQAPWSVLPLGSSAALGRDPAGVHDSPEPLQDIAANLVALTSSQLQRLPNRPRSSGLSYLLRKHQSDPCCFRDRVSRVGFLWPFSFPQQPPSERSGSL